MSVTRIFNSTVLFFLSILIICTKIKVWKIVREMSRGREIYIESYLKGKEELILYMKDN